MPEGDIAVQEPPGLPQPSPPNLTMVFMFVPMGLMMGASSLMFARPGSGPMPYVMGGVMMTAMFSMALGSLLRNAGQARRALDAERKDYLRYLAQLRRKLRATAAAQRASLLWRHPEPAALWAVVSGDRLWERRLTDGDYSEARIGLGAQRLATPIQSPQSKPIEDLEPLCTRALRRFLAAFASVPDLPVALLVRRFARVLLAGDSERSRGLARSLVAQLAAFHPPDELIIAACVSADRAAEWDWLKWLPHLQSREDDDGAGHRRLWADSYPGLEQVIGVEALRSRPRFDPALPVTAEQPLLLIVVDGVDIPRSARCGGAGFGNVTLLDVSGSLAWQAERNTMRLQVAADSVATVGVDDMGEDVSTVVGMPDSVTVEQARVIAKAMSGKRLGASVDKTEPLTQEVGLTDLLGITDPANPDLRELWRDRSAWDRLRVPLGVSSEGAPVELDIKESALGGSGPHGMLIGATGSGKSELLRTLVLALALTHPSDALNMILVDFKGGATFMGLEDLPHTSAVITNLADDLLMVDRMQDSLQGELMRRQEVLRAAEKTSQLEYEKARAAGKSLPPMPTLFVVVDEFSELLSAKREFIETFIMIGRLGRSLGVHLLLASQRLDEGRIHVLESHLSYRIALRTFSVMESRAVLGVPDASGLPPTPGAGYIKTDAVNLTRFKAAYVSGAYHAAVVRSGTPGAVTHDIQLFVPDYVEPSAVPEMSAVPESTDQAPTETVLTVLAGTLRGKGAPAQQVWLPPLGDPPTLEDLLGGIREHPELGLTRAHLPERGALSTPLGIVDRPFEQRRDLLLASLDGAKGHAAVVGAPQSGKSTLLRSLLLGLALSHTPLEVQFYCLDFGGGLLTGLQTLPHVGGVASRMEPEKLTRTLAELTSLLARREQTFSRLAVDSMAAYRKLRRDGRVTDDPFGDVFLVIDGIYTLRNDFSDLEPTVMALVSRGLTFGIHVIVTAGRWSDIRLQMRESLGSRFELHLGEAMDSMISPRAAGKVPDVPGRGLTHDQMHFLTGLPMAADGSREDHGQATSALVERIAAAWRGPSAPPVRLLPSRLEVDQLPSPDTGIAVPLGWDEDELSPVWHDFERTPHLMVFGDNESGKTNLLRLILRSIAARHPDGQAKFLIGDSHRDLQDAVPKSLQLGYAITGDVLAQHMADASPPLSRRVPGEDIPPERLPRRDWWKGPRIFVVVDDFEMFEGGGMGTGPLDPLLGVLPHGREISLHVILARSSAGAARSMIRPVLRRLWELGTPAVLLSCDKDEGRFLGDVRPRPLPPGRAQLVTRKRVTLMQTAVLSDHQDRTAVSGA